MKTPLLILALLPLIGCTGRQEEELPPLLEVEGMFGPPKLHVDVPSTQRSVRSDELTTVRQDMAVPEQTPPFASGKPGEVMWLAPVSRQVRVTDEAGREIAAGQVAGGQVVRLSPQGVYIGSRRISGPLNDKMTYHVYSADDVDEGFETTTVTPVPPPPREGS